MTQAQDFGKKCFKKLGKMEVEHLSSRSACQKTAHPYSAEQAE